MSNLFTAVDSPDSLLAKEATDLLREHSTELLFNHSIRVYLFAAEEAVNKRFVSIVNSSTSRPHFTISALSRSTQVQANDSRSMAQTRPVSS